MEKYIEKNFLAYIAEDDQKSAINEDARTIRFVISSNELDRDNEVVEPAAVAAAMKGFARNPVCLACHRHRLENGRSPVIGKWLPDTFKQLKSRCEMDLQFAETELAEEYWQLYSNIFMKSVSIGFRVLDFHEEQNDGKRRWIITKIELYEISCVPVGANRDALSKHKGFEDLIEAKTIGSLIEGIQELQKQTNQRINSLEESLLTSLDDLKDMIVPDPDGLAMALEPDSSNDPSTTGGTDTGQKLLEAFQKAITELQGEKNNGY